VSLHYALYDYFVIFKGVIIKLFCKCTIFEIMTEEKPNQKEQIKLKIENIQGFFKKGVSPREMQDVILRLLQDYQQKRLRAERNRDAR